MKQRLEQVRLRIDEACSLAGRSPREITLIAVSKTKPVEAIKEAQALGLADFGENYVNEAVSKYEELKDTPFRLHFIGHLQSNKAKLIVPAAHLIHSVDSLHLAKTINRHAEAAGKICDILLEVHISGEDSKNGFEPGEVLDAAKQIGDTCGNIRICGMMGMAPFLENKEETRPYFARLRKLYESLEPEQQKYLSMGMSGDFPQAILEGSNMIRVGTAIFGERDYSKQTGF